MGNGLRQQLPLVEILFRSVGDLPALQHRPAMSLHVVEEGGDKGCAQQQLITRTHTHTNTHSVVSGSFSTSV